MHHGAVYFNFVCIWCLRTTYLVISLPAKATTLFAESIFICCSPQTCHNARSLNLIIKIDFCIVIEILVRLFSAPAQVR